MTGPELPTDPATAVAKPGWPLVAACSEVVARLAAATRDRLQTAGLVVEPVPHLCTDAEALTAPLRRLDAMAVVVAVCHEPPSAVEYQVALSRAGIDPLAIELLDLSTLGPVEAPREQLRLAGLVAGAAAKVAGSLVDSRALRQPTFSPRLSRRNLLGLRAVRYRPVAGVDEARCLGTGCARCLPACPSAAIRMQAGASAEIDPAVCTGCGVCVTACPAGAVILPGAMPSQEEARLTALATFMTATGADPAPSDGAWGILYHCREQRMVLREAAGSGAALGPGWLPVELPCVAMVTTGWLLQVLVAGASAVALLPCDDARIGRVGGSIHERIEFCASILGALGLDADGRRVRLAGPDGGHSASNQRAGNLGAGTLDGLSPLRTVRTVQRAARIREPAATVEAIRACMDDPVAARMAVAPPIAGAASPLGWLHLDPDRCSTCGACARACPSAALTFVAGEEGSSLRYDHARCVPCSLCVAVCPEGALRVDAAVSLRQLASADLPLFEVPSRPCMDCGAPAMSPTLVAAVRGRLPAAVSTAVASADAPRCLACETASRGTAMLSQPPPAVARSRTDDPPMAS